MQMVVFDRQKHLKNCKSLLQTFSRSKEIGRRRSHARESSRALYQYYTKQKTLLYQGQHGTKLKETLINICENSTSIESTRSKAVLQDNNIEIVSAEENTASASTIDAES